MRKDMIKIVDRLKEASYIPPGERTPREITDRVTENGIVVFRQLVESFIGKMNPQQEIVFNEFADVYRKQVEAGFPATLKVEDILLKFKLLDAVKRARPFKKVSWWTATWVMLLKWMRRKWLSKARLLE